MIASSFIYYYSTSDEIEDDGLALRRVRLEVDSPNEEESHGVSPDATTSLRLSFIH